MEAGGRHPANDRIIPTRAATFAAVPSTWTGRTPLELHVGLIKALPAGDYKVSRLLRRAGGREIFRELDLQVISAPNVELLIRRIDSMTTIAHRVAESAGMLLIGDGVLALLRPREHCLLWRGGPDGWRRTAAWFAAHPQVTRTLAAAELCTGLWLARRQQPDAAARTSSSAGDARIGRGGDCEPADTLVTVITVPEHDLPPLR